MVEFSDIEQTSAVSNTLKQLISHLNYKDYSNITCFEYNVMKLKDMIGYIKIHMLKNYYVIMFYDLKANKVVLSKKKIKF